MSGSKTVSTLNGKVTPSCGYTTYKKWLDIQGNNELKCPGGDIITYYDNIEKYVIKNYRAFSKISSFGHNNSNSNIEYDP